MSNFQALKSILDLKSISWQRDKYVILFILNFVTLFFYKYTFSSISVILFLFVWLIDKNKQKPKTKKYLIVIGLFLILYIISFFFSENIKEASKNFQKALPFFAFSLILSTIPKFSKKNIQRIKFTYIITCFLATIYCYFTGVINWLTNTNIKPEEKEFFFFITYTRISEIIELHPTYFTIYIFLACIFLFELFYKTIKTKQRLIILLLIVYFFVFIGFLSSLMGILLMFSLVFYESIKFIYRNKKFKRNLALFSVVILGMVFTLVKAGERRKFAYYYADFKLSDLKDKTILNNKKPLRFVLIDIFISQTQKDILLGQGIGDLKDYTNTKYINYVIQKDVQYFKDHNYHNQYIQYFGYFGIIGGSLFLIILLSSIFQAFKVKDEEALKFILICSLFFLTESIMERHKGIVYFSLWFFFFVNNLKPEPQKIDERY